MQGFRSFPALGLSSYQSWPAVQSLDISRTKMSVSAATYLVHSSLPQLRHLSICHAPFSVQVAAKLSQSHWPRLETLRLWGSVSIAQSLQAIAKGQWPLLTTLEISRYQQDERKFFQMADFPLVELDPLQSSRWPLLQSLNAWGWNCIHLSGGQQACRWPELTSLTASHINPQDAAPKLRCLHLAAVTRADSLLNALALDLPALEELHVGLCCWDESASSPYLAGNLAVQGRWPALTKLSLSTQQLGLSSMVPITSTEWAQLQELDLSANYLREGSIECLVACHWPCLTWLGLANNLLDANAIRVLITGDWPRLVHLDLCENELCEAGCLHLARGAWPRLASLELGYCALDISCFHHLLKGYWPDLEALLLINNNLAVQEVYSVAQDIVNQHIACKFADLLTASSWFEECKLHCSDQDKLAEVSLHIL